MHIIGAQSPKEVAFIVYFLHHNGNLYEEGYFRVIQELYPISYPEDMM